MPRRIPETPRRVRRNGAALLEGIVALALLVLGMAIVGGQIHSAVRTMHETEELGRALMMSRSKLAQLDMGLIPPEETVEGNFGKMLPGHSWRVSLLPTQTPDVFLVRLEVLKGVLDAPFDDEREHELEQQEQEELPPDEEPRVVHAVYTLRIPPATLDLQRDFGVAQEELEKLADSGEGLPGDLLAELLSGQLTVADLNRLLDNESLLQLLPVLLQAFSSQLPPQFRDLANRSPDELADLLRSGGTDKADELDELAGPDSTAGTDSGEQADAQEAEGDRRGAGPSPDRPPTIEDLEALLRERGRRPKR